MRVGQGSVLTAMITLLMVPRAIAGGSESAVLELFETDVLLDNVAAVQSAANRLSSELRYEYLRKHVLPSSTHRDFRMLGILRPENPVKVSWEDEAASRATVDAGSNRARHRVRTGGKLESPVFDLVESARILGKLSQLRDEVLSCEVEGEIQRRCQLCLLALIELARGDEEAAGRAADQLFSRLLTGAFPRLIDRMPETLFVWAAAQHGILMTDAERFLVHIWDHQVQPSKLCGPGEWDRLISSLIGQVRYLKLDVEKHSQPYHHPPDLRDWHWVTKRYSWVIGNGVPSGHAQLLDRTVVQLAREDDEYLLFGIPLRENFTVECECSGFGYKDCHSFVAGKWLAPVHTYDTAWIGDVTKSLPNITLEPKLSQVDDWIRYRIEMRDGVCSRFINGRLIHDENLGANHDPWIAIRTPSYGEGSVRDVRITGNPVIPERIDLSAQGIESWVSWHDDQLSPENFSWHAEAMEPNETHLVGVKVPALNGSAAERLLRYHWPLVWDSEVAWDFFYSKDQSLVHPSIGQLAFLLTDKGVKTHWVTNGVWDSTGLDPLNQHEPAPQWQDRPLPLKQNQWNTMKLTVAGDSIALVLNGILILTHQLEPANDRAFGLFHYCDQSEARVRNVVLEGDWPKVLTPLKEQELRGIQSDELDRIRDELQDTFEFDFVKSTREESQTAFLFTNSVQGTESDFEMREDGLHASVKSPAGTMGIALIAPRITLQGDFDITADYEKLHMEIPDEGACGFYESIVFPSLANRTGSVIRSAGQYSNSPLRHVSQVELIDPDRGGAAYPRIIADESPSGRLRTCRRGKMLHFLTAAYGTENFRNLHSAEFTDQPIEPNSIQLRGLAMSFGKKEASMKVVWKKLLVKAERIVRH